MKDGDHDHGPCGVVLLFSSVIRNKLENTRKKRHNNNLNMLRPKRRASQTFRHFFKYHLADDPFKVEEEDLENAIVASMQQCHAATTTTTDHKPIIAVKNVKETSRSGVKARTRAPQKVGSYINGSELDKLDTEDFLACICFHRNQPKSAEPTTTLACRSNTENNCDTGPTSDDINPSSTPCDPSVDSDNNNAVAAAATAATAAIGGYNVAKHVTAEDDA